MVQTGKEFHFHYENEFGGVRDIEIPFLKGSNNILTVVSVRPIVISPGQSQMRSYMNELTCATQYGISLNDQALSVRVGGEKGMHIGKCQIYRLRPLKSRRSVGFNRQ